MKVFCFVLHRLGLFRRWTDESYNCGHRLIAPLHVRVHVPTYNATFKRWLPFTNQYFIDININKLPISAIKQALTDWSHQQRIIIIHSNSEFDRNLCE